jgi:ubiquinone biosynthesis protein Coq4
MQAMQEVNQTWQDDVIESIIDFVKAEDGGMVYVGKLAKTTDEPYAMQKLIDFLYQTAQGKQAFQKRQLIGDIDLEKLHSLPSNTLGYALAKHMLDRGLKPIKSDILRADDDIQFFKIHIAETHDIWHVVTGADTNIVGELQLEAFYVSQLYATRFWLGLIAKNLLKLTVGNIEASTQYMDAITTGWLMAKQAKPLFGINWNDLWENPLSEIRTDLNIVIQEI